MGDIVYFAPENPLLAKSKKLTKREKALHYVNGQRASHNYSTFEKLEDFEKLRNRPLSNEELDLLAESFERSMECARKLQESIKNKSVSPKVSVVSDVVIASGAVQSGSEKTPEPVEPAREPDISSSESSTNQTTKEDS